MDSTENTSKIQSSTPNRSTTIVALIIIVLQIAVSAGTYPFLWPLQRECELSGRMVIHATNRVIWNMANTSPLQ